MSADGIASIILSAEDKTGPAYQSAIRNLQAFQAQMKQGGANVEKFAQGAQFSTQQVQGLVHAVRAFTDQVLAGQSPVRAFALEFGKLSGTFGGAGNALTAVMGVLSPARLLFGALGAAVAGVGFALYESAKASKAFKDAVTLSGNFAGQTSSKFDATARNIAASSTVTVGQAKEAGQALIQTGEVGPEVFAAATEAVARYSNATGESATKVAKDFAGMADDVLKWATEHNKNLNFVTTAQLQQIKTLQETGHEVSAQALVYDALNDRLRQLDSNMGPLDRTLNALAKSWSSFWNSAKGGDTDSIEGRIAQAQRALEQAQQRRDATGSESGGGLTAEQKARIDAVAGRPASPLDQTADAAENLRLLQREQSAGEQNAAASALRAAEQKEGDAAHKRLDAILKESKGRLGLSEALKENARDFERAAKAGAPFKPEQQAVINRETRRKFSDSQDKSQTQADLEQRIKGIKDKLVEEQDQIKFHNDYLAGLYQAGEVSLRTFYDEQRKTTEQGVNARLAAIAEERAAVEKALAKSTDPVQRTKLTTQRTDLDAEASKVRQRAAEDVILSNQREAASFKALQDQIASFQEQLLSSTGDPLGAELKRIETTIAHIKVLAAQSQGAPGGAQITDEQVQALQQQLTIRAQLNESQREFSRLTAQASNAEELLLLQAKSGGKGLLQTEDELHALREKALAQLGDFIDRERERVALSKDPADLQHLDDLVLRYQQLQAAVDPRKLRLDSAADDIGSALAGGFERASEAGAKLSDILKDIGAQISRIVTRELVGKPIGDSIANFIKGTGNGSGGGGGLIELLTNATRPKPDPGVGLGTGGLTGDQRTKLFDHDTTPLTAAEAAPISGIAGVSGSGAQAAVIDRTTSALQGLADAANAASGALGKPPGTVAPAQPGSMPVGASTAAPVATTYPGDTTGEDYGNEARSAAASQAQAAKSLDDLGTTAQTSATTLDGALSSMAASALRGSNALGGLPGAFSMFTNYLTQLLSSSSGGGGGGGLLGLIFGSGGGAAAGGSATGTVASDAALELFFHSGGIVGTTHDLRPVAPGLFANARRMHDGGAVGADAAPAPLAGLAPNEVPAILMGGPIGTREEVLHASDPRHSDNLHGMTFAQLIGKLTNDSLGPWENATRYHGGGIVGHEVPSILMGGPKGLREEVLSANDPRHTDNGGGAMQALHIYVTPPPGMSRDSATQQGVQIGQGIQRALRRRGG